MNTKKPSIIRIFIWLFYLVVSLVLIWFAGGFALLLKKTEPALNIPVLAIACLIVLFSILRIYLELRKAKDSTKSDVTVEETIDDIEHQPIIKDEIKICIHCGKAEPLEAVYCSSCGSRFPDLP